MRQEENERIRLERIIGSRIREERERRGWTQDQLSLAMTSAGRPMASGRLSKIERGIYESPLSFRDIHAAASAFGLHPFALLVTHEEAGLLVALRQAGLPGVMQWASQALLDQQLTDRLK